MSTASSHSPTELKAGKEGRGLSASVMDELSVLAGRDAEVHYIKINKSRQLLASAAGRTCAPAWRSRWRPGSGCSCSGPSGSGWRWASPSSPSASSPASADGGAEGSWREPGAWSHLQWPWSPSERREEEKQTIRPRSQTWLLLNVLQCVAWKKNISWHFQ